MAEDARERTVEVEHGVRLHSRVDGDPRGGALLLIPSLGTDLSLWDVQAAALAGDHGVVRYDPRGSGRSDSPPPPYTLERLGLDAVAVLDAHGIERAAVCGVSLGGLVALWLGIHAAERVDRLLLAGTAARVGSEQGWRDRIAAVRNGGMTAIAPHVMERFFSAAFRARQPETVTHTMQALARQPADGYVGACAALAVADLRADLHRVRVPTLVVVGSEDEATPLAVAHELQTGIRGARLEILDGAGHLANLEAPTRFTGLLADHVGGPRG